MGGMIRQFVDTATGPGGIAIAASGADFDDIIGARADAMPASDGMPAASGRPDATRTIAAATPRARRRGGRAPALAAMTALAVSGIVIAGALVAAADLTVRGALTDTRAVLASDSADPAKATASKSIAFGSVAGLGDDLAVTVSDPIAFAPSPRAIGADAGIDVVSTVTVTNLGSGPVDPSVALVALGTPATRVFDPAQGIRTSTVVSLGAGDSMSYRVAWAVGDVAKLALSVTAPSGDAVVYGP